MLSTSCLPAETSNAKYSKNKVLHLEACTPLSVDRVPEDVVSVHILSHQCAAVSAVAMVSPENNRSVPL